MTEMSKYDVGTSHFERCAPFTTLGPDSNLSDIEKAWEQRTYSMFKPDQYTGHLAPVKPYVSFHNYPFLGDSVWLKAFINTRVAQEWYGKETLYCEVAEFNRAGFKLINPGDTVFDCGAHQGIYSMVFAHAAGPNGTVVSFEPVPINAQIARLNADINGYARIEVIPVGLGAKEQVITASMQAHSTASSASVAGIDTVDMQIATLNQFAVYKPNFIKIDIEGAEVDALSAAQEVLSHRPRLLISVHPPFMPAFNVRPQDIFKLINPDSYDCWCLESGRSIHPLDENTQMDTFFEVLFLPK